MAMERDRIFDVHRSFNEALSRVAEAEKRVPGSPGQDLIDSLPGGRRAWSLAGAGAVAVGALGLLLWSRRALAPEREPRRTEPARAS